ncbi:Tetratricopeptide TPR-1 [Corchorus olitorius]|uniref:Tetratricopeptide TPR-1 n=1 Tax=Corchorus olitorius TaxID=93759 RepID=A0A1R3KGH8_9ROSI|nr:Tetratricopeptide TPR-1 [Corchorus olitorius]
MAHIHSKEAEKVREQKLQESFLQLKSKGKEAVEKGDFHDAINYYTKAITCKPGDATMYSNRSFCFAHLNEGHKALSDAMRCAMLRPDWPKAFYRVGMAFMLLKDFDNAADAFLNGWKLDPKNKDLESALREAVQAQLRTN